jgi:hypothetical protein
MQDCALGVALVCPSENGGETIMCSCLPRQRNIVEFNLFCGPTFLFSFSFFFFFFYIQLTFYIWLYLSRAEPSLKLLDSARIYEIRARVEF